MPNCSLCFTGVVSVESLYIHCSSRPALHENYSALNTQGRCKDPTLRRAHKIKCKSAMTNQMDNSSRISTPSKTQTPSGAASIKLLPQQKSTPLNCAKLTNSTEKIITLLSSWPVSLHIFPNQWFSLAFQMHFKLLLPDLWASQSTLAFCCLAFTISPSPCSVHIV